MSSKYIKNVNAEVLSLEFSVSEMKKSNITTALIAGAIKATKKEHLDE